MAFYESRKSFIAGLYAGTGKTTGSVDGGMSKKLAEGALTGVPDCGEVRRNFGDDAFSGNQAPSPSDRMRQLTISGGEPFLQSGDLANLLNAVRSDRALSVRDILLYTGYTAEELQVDDKDSAVSRVLNLADVLIDGPYIEGQNDGKSPL